MSAYENLITNADEANKAMNQGNANPIDWKQSAYECILKSKNEQKVGKIVEYSSLINFVFPLVLLNQGRIAVGTKDEQVIEASNQLKAVGLLTREFKCIRAVWSRQCDYMHVYDEIKMVKSAFDATAEEASENMRTSLAKVR